MKDPISHLLLDLRGYSIPYVPIGGGPKPLNPPSVIGRADHASSIRKSIENAFVTQRKSLENLGATAPEAHGVQLTATARSRVGLRLESVRKAGSPIELLSTRGEGMEQRSIVFLPSSKVNTVYKRLDDYVSEDLKQAPSARRPDGFWFFESTAALRPATIHDLWFDVEHKLPHPGDEAEWEVWVRPDAPNIIRSFARPLRIRCNMGQLDFPGVSILRVRATAENIERLATVTGAVLELRSCSSLVLDVLESNKIAHKKLANTVVNSIKPPAADAPRVCILDTGVHYGHPLLSPALPANRCHTLNDAWAADGWDSHGTNVAGIVLYPNLERILSGSAVGQIKTALESVTILRKDDAPGSPIEGAGIVASAVGLVEQADEAKRVFCMAFASYDVEDGAPTSLSASVDQLAWGLNGEPRLFCVAAGNVLDDPLKVSGYPTRNIQSGIGSPGQAMNVLTVGGCTFIADHPLGGEMLADHGDLSPTARTALPWKYRRSIKPDVVFEAGNVGRHPDLDEVQLLPECGILTTTKNQSALFGTFHETSAATAGVAGMAGRLMAAYPDFWPETIRGLIVHSSSWTPAMLARVEDMEKQERMETLVGMFGGECRTRTPQHIVRLIA